MSGLPSSHSLDITGPIFGNELRIIWSSSDAEGGGVVWSDFCTPSAVQLEQAWQKGDPRVSLQQWPNLVFFLHPELLQVNQVTGATALLRRTLCLAEAPLHVPISPALALCRLLDVDSIAREHLTNVVSEALDTDSEMSNSD
jgi:hypothetical protein